MYCQHGGSSLFRRTCARFHGCPVSCTPAWRKLSICCISLYFGGRIHWFFCFWNVFHPSPYDVSISSNPSELSQQHGGRTDPRDGGLGQVCAHEEGSDEHVVGDHPSQHGRHNHHGASHQAHEVVGTHRDVGAGRPPLWPTLCLTGSINNRSFHRLFTIF